MSRSTATFIAYDLRPAKQIERRMLIDFVRSASAVGLDLSSYKYVGMGGIRFIDFLMAHRYLGITSMVSLEQDDGIVPRCRLNNPLKCITLFEGDSSSFISGDVISEPRLVWLDYDWSLSRAAIDDITSLGTKLVPGSFLFCTVSGSAPRFLESKSTEERAAHYKEELGDFSLDYGPADFTNSAFPESIARMLLAIFIFAFSSRTDGIFIPMFRVVYVDSMPMVTIGGIFVDDKVSNAVVNSVSRSIPPLGALGEGELYKIDVPNLTEIERRLFELAATDIGNDPALLSSITDLGFEVTEIDAYKPLVRFAPRYVETYL